jgi:DNA-binding MarR family transcriptional regulator
LNNFMAEPEEPRTGTPGGDGGEAAGGFDPARADFSLAALFAGWALADEVQRRIAADGLDDLRFADGVVFQHLVSGPRTIGSLAERLGVSQQATSKAVADLERRGYVRRAADPADGRARQVALTERGQSAITAGRRHRAAVAAELGARLGEERVEAARRTLVDALEAFGGAAAVRGRRVRPPA